MIIRIIVVLLVLGGVAGFYGIRDYVVSAGTTPEPQEINLEDIEAGSEITNNHLKIGFHWAVMDASIYWYELEEDETEADLTDYTTVTSTYYPIISDSHPYILALRETIDTYGSWDNVPDEEWPVMEEFSVLVKTDKYSYIGAIPTDFLDVESVEGLVVNRIKKLDSTERELFQESFPNMDLSQALILEEGRKPKSLLFSFFLMGLGAVLILVAVGLIVKLVKEDRAKRPPKPEEGF